MRSSSINDMGFVYFTSYFLCQGKDTLSLRFNNNFFYYEQYTRPLQTIILLHMTKMYTAYQDTIRQIFSVGVSLVWKNISMNQIHQIIDKIKVAVK